MEKLFNPQSIVILGISEKPGNIPRIILENLIRWRYRGRLFGVNPGSVSEHVDGIRMYKYIEELPIVPDLAVILIPSRFVPDAVEACGKFGINRVAIPSGGFNELGEEGQKLTARMLENAGKYRIRFAGPNGLTVANTANGLCLPFVPLYMPPKGGLSIITQSGGLGIMLWNMLVEEDVGMAKFASIGNKLDLDEVDFLRYFGKDPETRVICLYLESITRGRELCDVASRMDKPVIVMKSNTTEIGGKTAMSHTAAVSNNDDVVNAAFDRAGIIRINHFSEFVSIAKAFSLPPMRGNRIMMMSPAGGFTVLMADMCEKMGFEPADPGKAFYKELEKSSNAGIIKFSNPLDMGDIYDSRMYTHTFFSVMHCDNVDGAVYVSQWPEMPKGDDPFHQMFQTDISKEVIGSILSSNKPFGICLFGQSKTTRQIKKNMSIPIFNTLEEMMKALMLQKDYYARKLKSTEKIAGLSGVRDIDAVQWLKKHQGNVGEDAMALLSHFSIITAESRVADTVEQAVKLAQSLGYPVVMKVCSPDVMHKTEAGGVVLNVQNEESVRANYAGIKSNLLNYNKDATFSGVRVMKQAEDGHDMFIGGIYDNNFGPVVFFGYGGIYIEVFKDIAGVMCPASREEIAARLETLKSYEILKGVRNGKSMDVEGYVDTIHRVTYLMWRFPEIKELDLNPVRISPGVNGAVVLDARMKISKERADRDELGKIFDER